MTQEATVGEQTKTVEDLKAELHAAVTKYENLNRAQDKLKEDLKEYKTKSNLVEDLQKQVENLTVEKTTLVSDFDAFKTNIKQQETKQLLTSKLEEAGVKSTATALKLLDMDAIKFDETGAVIEDSLKGAIEALKTEHAVIFGEKDSTSKPSAPAVKHAVDTVTKSAYESEMAAAVKSGSQQQLEEVFAKYQKH